MDEDADVAAQLLLGAAAPRPPARAASVVARMASMADLQHFAVEPELVAEVIVHRGDVGVRGPADLAHRHLLEAAIGEQTLAGLQQPIARRIVGAVDAAPPRRVPSVGFHSVRLKSIVAAVIATTEKISRNIRSPAIAAKPVFLSSRLLNACTA